METSLFPHMPQHDVPDSWMVSLGSQHSDEIGKKKYIINSKCQGTWLIFSDIKVSFYLCFLWILFLVLFVYCFFLIYALGKNLLNR